MKFFIILLITALIQSAFAPFNLCLVLLICKIYNEENDSSLILATLTGILLGILTSVNIGFYALVFLIVSKLIQIFKASRISSNLLTGFLFAVLMVLLVNVLEQLYLHTSINPTKILVEGLLLVPVYLVDRFIFEHFTQNTTITLKFRS